MDEAVDCTRPRGLSGEGQSADRLFRNRPFAEMVKGAAHCVQNTSRRYPMDALQSSIIGTASGSHRPLKEGIPAVNRILTQRTLPNGRTFIFV